MGSQPCLDRHRADQLRHMADDHPLDDLLAKTQRLDRRVAGWATDRADHWANNNWNVKNLVAVHDPL